MKYTKPSFLTRAAHALGALSLLTGLFISLQFFTPPAVSAGTVPPPAECGAGAEYDFGDSTCWGVAGKPPTTPSPCVANGKVVGTYSDCLLWKSKLPEQSFPISGFNCPTGTIVGPLQSCCQPTDKACLSGSLTTPQGDATSLFLAKAVCSEIGAVKGISPSQIPAQCSLTQPSLEAGLAVCQAVAGKDPINDNASLIIPNCAKLIVGSAGEVPATSGPAPGDNDTTDAICAFIKGNATVDQAQVPKGCAGTPAVADGVDACKVFLLSSASSSDAGKPFIPKCFDLVTRNPGNSIAPVVKPVSAIPAGFDDTNLKKLTTGLTFFALIICVGGIFVSCALWAVGAKANNEGQQHTGKRGLIVCLLAAFLIGALPVLFTTFDNLSHKAGNSQIVDGT